MPPRARPIEFVAGPLKRYYRYSHGKDNINNIIYSDIWLAVLICFSVTDRTSWNDVPNWVVETRRLAPENVIIFIVACKCDARDRVVTTEEIKVMRSITSWNA